MGKSNIAVKQWLRNKNRFADLFNGIVFQGEQVVLPEELKERDSEVGIITTDKEETEKGTQKYRDIVMEWKKGPQLAILACENQKKVHYAMPVRVLLYDGLSYTDQIRQIWQQRNPKEPVTEEEYLSQFHKEDKIYPVITLIFYYGLTPWDGSTDLYGMFWQENEIRSREMLSKFIPNYPLNLIDVGNVKDENRFRTDLQQTFGMLKYRGKSKELKEYLERHRDYFESVDRETYQALRELLHSRRQLKQVLVTKEGKESVNMCKALEDIYNEGVSTGIEQGMASVVQALIKAWKELGLTGTEMQERLQTEVNISEENAKRYVEQYEG